jgi:hypothetical protein
MSDQRHLADFRSSTRRNEYIKYINDIYRDDQYRLFLQSNGANILDREWQANKMFNSCWENPCVHKYPTRINNEIATQEKVLYDSIHNKKTNEPLAPYRVCDNFKDYRMTN